MPVADGRREFFRCVGHGVVDGAVNRPGRVVGKGSFQSCAVLAGEDWIRVAPNDQSRQR